MQKSNYQDDTSTTTLKAVEQKFKSGEVVLVILETYQIVGAEHQNRLLAIVQSGNSSALFSFNLSNNPPKIFSDITVNDVFPINGTFFIDSNSGIGISSHQFTILSENVQSTYYFYPNEETFQSKVVFDKILKRLIQEYSEEKRSDFEWLEPYKQKDHSEIDLNIALNKNPPKNRESKFKEELERRKPEYTFHEPYKIYCATWNVNNKTPSEDFDSLREWLAISEDAPDIYAIGLQEIDMSPDAIVRNETRIDYNWVAKIMEALHPADTYVHLESCRLVGMMLTICVKKSLRSKITKILKSDVGTGTLKFGNKGGVGVSFQLNETYICFVNSHLAAHVGEVERRKEDHDEIIRRMAFNDGSSLNRSRTILEHHQVFWIGDLNYRLTETNGEKIRTFCDYDKIFYLDQFYIEHKRGNIFKDFQEGKINFRPTYKYDPGTDNFDSSEKARAPAWCDRILWKGTKIEQLSYNSVMELRMSDHKPVYSVFIAYILTRDEQKFKKVHEEALKTVDKYENDNQPQITVAETDLDFGCLRYHEVCSRELLVANNCHLPVKYKFKPKDDFGNICEDYIKIFNQEGELLTGNSQSIRVDIFIDEKSAANIMKRFQNIPSGEKIHLDILVLHVENGRDIFITIYGEYQPSSFGLKLETLMKLQKPLVEYGNYDVLALEDSHNVPYTSDFIVPREIWLLIDYLYKNGLSTRNLITLQRKHRRSPRICAIRDWLDTRSIESFPGTPQTALEALLKIFEALPEPLLSEISERELMTMIYGTHFQKCLELLNKVSSLNRKTFLYVILFLKELQSNCSSNGIDDSVILKIFSQVLFRHKNEQHGQKFIIQFMTNDIRKTIKDEFENN